ncbi:MAG: hypothetical protein LAN62_16400 [Acidobacteriia bacterium]|nr:hypothetical protein [Terriglobia bacterium]
MGTSVRSHQVTLMESFSDGESRHVVQASDEFLFRTPSEVRGPQVSVLFTGFGETLAALRLVARLGEGLELRPRVLIVCALPVAVELASYLLPPGFLEHQIGALARESPLEFSVQICLCRCPSERLYQLLEHLPLIVIGGRKRLWPTKEQRLVRRLETNGHNAIFAELR